MNAYRFLLEKSEAALNIVFGSALGAYLGVAMSMKPEAISPISLGMFLSLIYFFVRGLLGAQHYAREKYWPPFFIIFVLTGISLYLASRLSSTLPLDKDVFLAIGIVWWISIAIETAQSMIFEKFAPRKTNP